MIEPCETADHPACDSRGESPPAAPRAVRILLAEDMPANQMVTVKILEKYGHKVSVAENGDEAIEAWQREPFDLVLMDVQMPLVDGLSAAAEIRRQEAKNGKARTPIIALTAYAMKGDRQRCLASGMDDYLSKPIDTADLLAMVQRFTGRLLDQPTHQAAVSPEAPSCLDEKALLERLDNDKELAKRLIALYCDDSPKLLKAIGTALMAGDLTSASFVAHRLSGLVRNFDARHAADAAMRLELACSNGDLVAAQAIFELLTSAVADLSRQVERFCGQLD